MILNYKLIYFYPINQVWFTRFALYRQQLNWAAVYCRENQLYSGWLNKPNILILVFTLKISSKLYRFGEMVVINFNCYCVVFSNATHQPYNHLANLKFGFLIKLSKWLDRAKSSQVYKRYKWQSAPTGKSDRSTPIGHKPDTKKNRPVGDSLAIVNFR